MTQVDGVQDYRRLLDSFENTIDQLRVDRSHDGNRPALKKPLLILLIISRIESEELADNRIRFVDIEDKLGELIRDYGCKPLKAGAHPEQPFFFMKNDSIPDSGCFWSIHLPDGTPVPHGKPPDMRTLRSDETYGSLDQSFFDMLKSSREARARIAGFVLRRWWPNTWHEEIEAELSLPALTYGEDRRETRRDSADRRRRSRGFVGKVLSNYRNRCAFCGFHALLNRSPFGLDAAHIQWVANDGPDTSDNGLALCKFHHWAFDRGVLTLEPDRLTIKVSKTFVAQEDTSRRWIESIDGAAFERPRDTMPADVYLKWHHDFIFYK